MSPATKYQKELRVLADAYGFDKLSDEDLLKLTAAMFHYYALRLGNNIKENHERETRQNRLRYVSRRYSGKH